MEPELTAEPLNRLDSVASNRLRRSPSPSAQLHRNIFGVEPSTSSASDSASRASSSNESIAQSSRSLVNGDDKPRTIKFNIHNNYNTYELNISDRSTVGDLKQRIYELTSVPICRQALRGWTHSNDNYTSSTKLSTMDLADENEVIVTDFTRDGGAVDDDSVERLSSQFTLNILNEKNGKRLQLKFPGTHTILDVKRDVYTVTNIAMRHQQWIGWPPDISDDIPLALSGIPLEHDLILKSTEPIPTRVTGESSNLQNETIEIDSDSSVDEFEDASDFNGDDEVFVSPATNRRLKNLSECLISLLYS